MMAPPSSWLSGPLGRFIPLQRGFDLPVGDVVPGEYPVVYSNGIGRHHNAAMVDGPGVITGRSGTIGKVHFVEDPYWPHNTALWVTDFRYCDPRFAYHFLQALGLERFSSGSGVPTLNRNDAHSFVVSIPQSRGEQRAIAAALDDADMLISSLGRILKKKQAIKQGMAQRLLIGETRLPGFDSPWTEIRLGDVGGTYSGLTGKSKADFGSGSSQFVTFVDVINNVRVRGDALELVVVGGSERHNQVAQGDVIFNGSSETPEEVALGAAIDFAPDPGTYLNSFCFGYRITRRSLVDPLYLAYMTRSHIGRRLVFSLAQGATRFNISKRQFLNLGPAFPPIEEQQAITAVLQDADTEIAALKQRWAKASDIKRGMAQQLLGGVVRLGDPEPVA